ncbi:MAG: helix-turn-helix transcriptional regulator [Solirubrobacterales bacterium]|nr:helix-turn-helix transcriptional regulator [Solirubrobacterales bacterium]
MLVRGKCINGRIGVTIPHVPPAKRHPYDQWSPDARALDLVGDKWTLLIVRDLISGPRRFVELQRVLPGISTEQLRSRLNRMVADGMLTRKRYREVPPRVDYELTERAEELAPVLGELARWGYQWAWGSPRASENIDVGAIFRLIPGLLDSVTGVAGTVELVVTDGHDGRSARYLTRVGPARATLSEGAESHADARISGSLTAWIEALGPAADRVELQVTGNQRLAGVLLDLLSPAQGRAPAPAIAEAAE